MSVAMSETAEAEPDGPERVIPLADRAWLERHRAGEAAAFAELVQAHRARVYGYLVRCGIGPGERDDVFQEAFLKVHRAALDTPPSGPLVPWVLAIVVSTVRSHFRRAKVRSIVRLDDERAEAEAADDPAPDETLEARRTALWLEAQIAKLPLEQREALVLCAIEGMELRDAAEALGAPADTVKTRLRRARLALAEARARLAVREEREGSR